MQTNEQIFDEIRNQGFITERQIKLLKQRSQREQRDLFDYSLKESVSEGDGVPVAAEWGAKGLVALKKWAKQRKALVGWRENNVIEHATADSFRFKGFHNCGSETVKDFQAVYLVDTPEGSIEYYYYGGFQVCG